MILKLNRKAISQARQIEYPQMKMLDMAFGSWDLILYRGSYYENSRELKGITGEY